MCTDPVSRYLSRYGEPEAAAVPLPGRNYDNAIVIPCYDEQPGCLDAVLDLVEGSPLAIVVVNAPDDAPAASLARTRALWRNLAGETNEAFRWTRTTGGIDVLAIDRASPGRRIPRRQGVGLARKIGADAACALFAGGALRSPWLYFTDADVRLPRDYLHHPPARPGTLVMPYRHEAGGPLESRAKHYELHLRYHVDRLRYAGSPYAFHTIGSTIAIHAGVYAKVRGIPRRNAGEDFYLLNKAAKVAPVFAATRPKIVIRARLSNRVPFGTGPALQAMGDVATFNSYAHESFDLLRQAIGFIDQGDPIQSRTRSLLEELGFFHRLERAKAQYRHPETLRKAMHQWFDAFRTLRFIHLARRWHPDRPLKSTLDGVYGKRDHLLLLKQREQRTNRTFGVQAPDRRTCAEITSSTRTAASSPAP